MADRDASELGRCPECLVLEGRHAHDCVTGDKAFEAYEDARQHPTTPTPEPVAPTAVTAEWIVGVIDAWRRNPEPTEAVMRTLRGYAVEVGAQATALRSEIADLRGKLERERSDVAALNSAFNDALADVVVARGERDAATSRATEAERLLRDITERLGKEELEYLANNMRHHVRAQFAAAVESLVRDIWAARKHLSTLPGSKEGE